MEVFSSVQFWIAVLSGGAVVKVLEHVLPVFVNRRKRNLDSDAEEKANLRRDIEYLRNEIQILRKEVEDLRREVAVQQEQTGFWRARYWDARALLSRVLSVVRAHNCAELTHEVEEIILTEEEVKESDSV